MDNAIFHIVNHLHHFLTNKRKKLFHKNKDKNKKERKTV